MLIEAGELVDTVLGVWPSPMFYAGPVEVLWHLASRTFNFPGITHFVVGRDPAGVKVDGNDAYSPFAGQIALRSYPLLKKIKILEFRPVGLSRVTGEMEYMDQAAKPEDFHAISGSTVRETAKKGGELAKGFMQAEAWEVLRAYYSGTDCEKL